MSQDRVEVLQEKIPLVLLFGGARKRLRLLLVRSGQVFVAGNLGCSGERFMRVGGPNNIFLGAESGDDPSVYIPAALADLGNDLLMLAGMGARHLFVPSMPDPGLTPEARGMGPAAMAGLSALSAAYNGGVAQLLEGLETAFDPLGIDLFSFDTAAFFAEITANPAAFGLTNTTNSCLFTAPTLCSTYLYFDNVHPTTAAHDLHALRFATAVGIVPEPAMSGLLLIALVGLWGLRRRATIR